jgi:hypothetical protein
MLLNKAKLIAIQKGKKRNTLPIEPINNFNLKTKISTITITKQLS